MLGPAEDAQALELPVGDGVLLQHAADGETHRKLGLVGHQVLVLGLLQSAGVTGVGAVVLLLQLLAGEDGVLGVDDDDVVAAVDVGGVISAASAAVLPMGLPAASRTYHLRVTDSLVSMVVDIVEPPYRIKCFDIFRRACYNLFKESHRRAFTLYHSVFLLSTAFLILNLKSPEISQMLPKAFEF